jgi:hypothetical protein
MVCQTEVCLGQDLTFTVTTHDPDTGELTDADTPPIYRLYEDENPVPLLTGNMAFLDPVNTTGFYSELVACTAANGFEVDRSYNIYIEATVDGDPGGLSYAFTVLEALAGLVAKLTVTEENLLDIQVETADILDIDITDETILIITATDDP